MNPYKQLSNPKTAFWKNAVAGAGSFGLSELYKKKFNILETDYVVTAGSCFAQHIGNRLQSSGFNYLDVEPAPCPLDKDEERRLGYGIYSGRYGNIYTARQLA